MAFPCPYCQFRIAVKAPPKPGRYTPSCPKCKAKIALTVPDDPAAEWKAAKVPGQQPQLPGDPAEPAPPPSKPVPKPPPPPKSERKPAPPPKPAPEPADVTEATGDFGRPPVGDATEVTGDFGSPPAAEDRTAVHTSTPAVDDQTAVFADSGKTEVGNDATMAHTEAGVRPAKKAKKDKPPPTDVDIPNTLGGYEVVKELGRGGMGAVYLARQVSLDRPVALKVMNSKWASDPVFLARFTREAFAAAQLVHHNVVQIYDIGDAEGINFFSMEFVEGKSLGDVLKKDGKLGVEAAVGYVLQAARGLKFAHDRGMVHRDVKPDNLMLNVHGIVKVADLGLVKTPAMTAEDDRSPSRAKTEHGSRPSMSGLRSLPSDITMAHTAMGSPAYMSPEQGKDAAAVDPRADVYSLGCTLYALLAGRPPFQGGNVFDILAKHAAEPPAPIPDVPKEVNAVVLKALAKSPDARQQGMDEFVADLERLLPNKGGARGPTEEHLNTLEDCVRRFQSAGMAKVRKALIPAFYLGGLLAAVIGLFVSGLVTGGVIALLIETTLAYFVIDGLYRKSYVFRRTREWLFGARLGDWVMGVLGGILFVLVLWLVGLLWVWLGTAVVAVGIAFLFHLVIDRRLAAQRRGAVEDCEKMLKRLRVAGTDEEALRLFVAKNAGRNWEEFFEALFGYEAKLAARPAVEEQAGGRLPRYAGWREPVIGRLDRAEQARREARNRKVLQKVEAKKLEAEGVNRKEAAAQAEAAAEQMVEKAAEIKAAKKKPVNVKAMLSAAEKPPKKLPKPPGYRLRKAVDAATGWKVRFLVGLLLIAAGALWVRTMINPEQLAASYGNVTGAQTDAAAQEAARQAAGTFSGLLSQGTPADVPVLGKVSLIDSLNPLVAGVIILLSVFNRRAVGIVLQMVGALVTLVGHQFGLIPSLDPIEPHHVTMVVGMGLAILGGFLGRK